MSSGEGLIHAIRDARSGFDHKGEKALVDAGITDKRLLVVESEFASTLRVIRREGNTLSAVMRNAWDGRPLHILTRKSPDSAREAHISVLGHITIEELRRELTRMDATNGFANRFLWICARRSQFLPDGGNPPPSLLDDCRLRVIEALRAAREKRTLGRDEQANDLWHQEYERLSEGRPGLLGAVTSRAEAQVMRLALIFALLDAADAIRCDHLRAGLEVWRYCRESARVIFGDSLGDETADTILRHLRERSLPRSEISSLFMGHKTKRDLERALRLLFHCDLAYPTQEETGGRPKEVWHAD